MFLPILTVFGGCSSIKSVPNARNDEAVRSRQRAHGEPSNEGEGEIDSAASSIVPTVNSFLDYETYILIFRFLFGGPL